MAAMMMTDALFRKMHPELRSVGSIDGMGMDGWMDGWMDCGWCVG